MSITYNFDEAWPGADWAEGEARIGWTGNWQTLTRESSDDTAHVTATFGNDGIARRTDSWDDAQSSELTYSTTEAGNTAFHGPMVLYNDSDGTFFKITVSSQTSVTINYYDGAGAFGTILGASGSITSIVPGDRLRLTANGDGTLTGYFNDVAIVGMINQAIPSGIGNESGTPGIALYSQTSATHPSISAWTGTGESSSATTSEHTSDAILLSENEISSTTDSVLLIEKTKVHESNALLRKETEEYHTGDAVLVSENNTSNTSDALLQKSVDIDSTSDALLSSDNSILYTTDSYLLLPIEHEHTTDASLLEIKSEEHTSDAIISTGRAVSNTSDAALREKKIQEHTSDAEITTLTTTRRTSDAALLKENVVSHTSDAVLGTAISGPDVSLTLRPESDSTIQLSPIGNTPNYRCVNQSKNNNDTAYVQAGTFGGVDTTLSDIYNVEDSGISNDYLAITNVKVSTRSRYAGEKSIALATAGLVINGNTHNGNNTDLSTAYVLTDDNWTLNPDTGQKWTWSDIDALKLSIKLRVKDVFLGITGRVTQQYITVTYHQITIVEETNYNTTTDAYLANRNSASYTSDSALSLKRDISHTSDALFSESNRAVYFSDAALTGIPTIEYTSDAALQKKEDVEYTSDSKLIYNVEVSHTIDATLSAGKVVSHTSDCFLDTNVRTEYETDAHLKATSTEGYTSDTLLIGSFLKSHTTDCALYEEKVINNTTDCMLRGELSQDYTTDCVLYGTNPYWEIYENLTSSDGIPYAGVKGRANIIESNTSDGKPQYAESDSSGKISWTFPAGVTVYIFIREAGVKKTIIVPSIGIASTRMSDL